jgi:hypothetical protein
MLRVGQRHIAWTAFERAALLADRFWPDPDTREFLRRHCRKRQDEIEQTLLHPLPNHRAGLPTVPPLSPEEVADLRPRFEAELAYGEGYQRAYQEYEQKRIADGVPITDEHFFDAFHAGREPIATPVGPEEWFEWVPPRKMYEYAAQRRWAWGAFGAGLAAVVVAAFMWWQAGRTNRREQPVSSLD